MLAAVLQAARQTTQSLDSPIADGTYGQLLKKWNLGVNGLEKALEALKRRLGVLPVGYHAPYGERCDEFRTSLVRRGFLYSSSWRDDVRPLYDAACLACNDISPSSKESGEPHVSLRSTNLCGR